MAAAPSAVMDAAVFFCTAAVGAGFVAARNDSASAKTAAARKLRAADAAHQSAGRAPAPPVTHDIMVRAGRGQAVPRSPMWAMRQAGRYLPEFLALRSYNFLERVHTPELAAEITLQPLRRYRKQLDAVVIFSDILIVPPAMGIPVAFRPGPQFGRLLETPADLDSLNFKPDIGKSFAFLFEAIALTRKLAAAPQGAPFDVEAFRREYGAGPVPAAAVSAQEGGSSAGEEDGYRLPRAALHAELLADIATGAASAGKAVPVIGFVGAPWTLMSYMIDGDLAHSTAAPHASTGAGASSAPSATSETPTAVPAAHDASSVQPSESATAASTMGDAGGHATAAAGSAAAATLAGGKAGERGLVGHKTYERSKRWLYHVSARLENDGDRRRCIDPAVG